MEVFNILEGYQNITILIKSSAVAEMGDHGVATIDMGQKLCGGSAFLGEVT